MWKKNSNLIADFTGGVNFLVAPSLNALPMSKLHAKPKKNQSMIHKSQTSWKF